MLPRPAAAQTGAPAGHVDPLSSSWEDFDRAEEGRGVTGAPLTSSSGNSGDGTAANAQHYNSSSATTAAGTLVRLPSVPPRVAAAPSRAGEETKGDARYLIHNSSSSFYGAAGDDGGAWDSPPVSPTISRRGGGGDTAGNGNGALITARRASSDASGDSATAAASWLLPGGPGGGGLWEGPVGVLSSGGVRRREPDLSLLPAPSGPFASLRCTAASAFECAAALAESPRLPAPGASTWTARRTIGLCLLVILSIAALRHATPANLHAAVQAMRRGLRRHPAAWAALYSLVFTVGVVLLLPGMLFSIAAGAAFGFATGTLVSFLSTVAGMTLAFLLGRYLFHDAVASALLRRVPNFAAIDRGVAREGWKLVLLLRLSPLLPYNIMNYALGATSVRLAAYVLPSAAAAAPYSLLFAYLGAAADDLLAALGGGDNSGSSGGGSGEGGAPNGSGGAMWAAAGGSLALVSAVGLVQICRRLAAASGAVVDGEAGGSTATGAAAGGDRLPGAAARRDYAPLQQRGDEYDSGGVGGGAGARLNGGSGATGAVGGFGARRWIQMGRVSAASNSANDDGSGGGGSSGGGGGLRFSGPRVVPGGAIPVASPPAAHRRVPVGGGV